MQPQANRERIIIRTSLAHALPPVMADAGALRQIVLNLVGNSIHVARAGGQVIVSTALTDLGDVVLRIRDTGRGLNHSEMEAALEQFRNPAADQLAQDNVGINLSLTRALVEANQAQFHIKSAPQSGTLVEIGVHAKSCAGGLSRCSECTVGQTCVVRSARGDATASSENFVRAMSDTSRHNCTINH